MHGDASEWDQCICCPVLQTTAPISARLNGSAKWWISSDLAATQSGTRLHHYQPYAPAIGDAALRHSGISASAAPTLTDSHLVLVTEGTSGPGVWVSRGLHQGPCLRAGRRRDPDRNCWHCIGSSLSCIVCQLRRRGSVATCLTWQSPHGGREKRRPPRCIPRPGLNRWCAEKRRHRVLICLFPGTTAPLLTSPSYMDIPYR